MRIRIQDSRNGLHPSEVVVVVRTISGTESLVVDKKSVSDEWLEVGQPLDQQDQNVLVELPRETYSGTWRVWVPHTSLARQAA